MLRDKLRTVKDLSARAFRILNLHQQRTYGVSLLFMFMSSLLEILTLGLLIPFITAIGSPNTFTGFAYLKSFLPLLNRLHGYYPAAVLGIFVSFLFIVKNIVSYYLYAYYNRFVYSVAADISKDKMFEYYKLNFPEYQKRSTAEMLREIAFIPVEFSQHIILGSMTIVSEFILIVLYTAAMAMLQFQVFMLTICTLLPFVAFAWIVSVRYLRSARCTIQQRSASNLKTLSDSLSAFQEATLYHKEKYFTERYIEGQRDLNVQLGKLNAANAIPARLSEIFAIAGMMLILFFYIRTQEYISTSVITVLTVFVAFAFRVIPSFNKILNAAVHMHTYSFTIDLCTQTRSLEASRVYSNKLTSAVLPFRDHIELQNITFRYPERAAPVLQNLSLQIHKSDVLGIVGRSGLGKTTIIRILLQLVRQTSGDITVDGKILGRNDLASWQNLFCYVPQDPFILSDSVSANVAFGLPDIHMNVQSVKENLQKVGLYETVCRMPQGINSILGERGNTLSGGQKQRLAVARALYRNADIFIFDEALNELDKASEEEMIALIDSLHRSGKTILMVSHHSRTLSLCNTIYSLKNGRLHKMEQSALSGIPAS
jgi:ABC-type bacteriocin/lantibiotic exporter with double-glycine peptidase domain